MNQRSSMEKNKNYLIDVTPIFNHKKAPFFSNRIAYFLLYPHTAQNSSSIFAFSDLSAFMAIPGVAQVIYKKNANKFNSVQEVEALLKAMHHLQAMNKSILSSLTKDAPEYAQFEKLTKELEKVNLSKLSDKDIKAVTKQIEKMNKLDVTKMSPAEMLKNKVSNPAVVAEAQTEVKADASTTFSKKR